MSTIREDFEVWWTKQGQFCRAGGGEYEKTFAFRAYEAATERAAAVCADVDEPAWYGFECPYSFQDGKVACIAAIRAQTGGDSA